MTSTDSDAGNAQEQSAKFQEVYAGLAYGYNLAIAFLVFSWPFVGMRVFTRGWLIRSFGKDDWLIVIAQLLYSIYLGMTAYVNAHGKDPALQTDLRAIVDLYTLVVVAECIFVLTQIFLKLSVVVLFLRLTIERWQRIVLYVTACLGTAISISCMLVLIFQCGVPGDYLILDLTGKCLPKSAAIGLTYLNSANITAMDLILGLLPLCMVWNMHVDIRTKISIFYILGIAAAGSICSGIRFQYISHNVADEEFFFNIINFASWSSAEAFTGIVAACLATLKPLVRRLFTSEPSNTIRFRAPKASWNIPTTGRTGNESVDHAPPSRGEPWDDDAADLIFRTAEKKDSTGHAIELVDTTKKDWSSAHKIEPDQHSLKETV